MESNNQEVTDENQSQLSDNSKKDNQANDQKLNEIMQGTEAVNTMFGQKYEEMVNKMFKEEFFNVCKGYFKTNLKLNGIQKSDRLFSNWAHIKKKNTIKDDMSQNEKNKDQKDVEEMAPQQLSSQDQDFLKNVEIDGAAYVSTTKEVKVTAMP